MKTFLLLSCAIAALATSSEDFTTANNKFAAAIYAEISKGADVNFLVSPLSAATVLALTQDGAKGKTGQQVRTALHLPEDTASIKDGAKELLPSLRGNDKYTLQSANKLYVKDNFVVNPEFQKVATEVYSAGVENVDFLKKRETAGVINAWVEKQTENRIQNLLDPELLNNETRLVLVNALYFKANWSHPFQLINTKKLNFYKTATKSVEVDALHNQYGDRFLFFECHHLNAKFLELPFQGNEASITFILPNERTGLSALESQIDRALLPHNVTRQRVDVAIPKFKINSNVNLKEILQKLGVTTIFTDFEANLSGIAGDKGDLVVNEVLQKSFIDVNEEGVEAAAATLEIIGVPAMAFPGKPQEFVADHPFLFYLKVKGVIIFVGRVADPTL